jgi:hypothetical protein
LRSVVAIYSESKVAVPKKNDIGEVIARSEGALL